MEKTGIVTKIENEIAVVNVVRGSACGENCAMCKGNCSPTSQRVKADNKIGAKVGDVVTVEMSEKKVLAAAFFVYILPLILAVTGYGVYGWIGSIIGFALPLVMLKFIDKGLSEIYRANITKIGGKSL